MPLNPFLRTIQTQLPNRFLHFLFFTRIFATIVCQLDAFKTVDRFELDDDVEWFGSFRFGMGQ